MATRVISTKLSVEGEAEFKKQMGDVNSHLKTLKSEMSVVTAEFKGQANTLEALTAKDKILREQLEQQVEKMRALEEAVKQAAEAYGEQDKRTDGYKQSLNAAKAAVANLNRELEDNEKYLKEASAAADGCAKSIDGFGKEVKSVEDVPSVFKRVSSAVGNFNDKVNDGKARVKQFGDILKGNLASEAIIGGVKALASAVGSIAASAKESIMAAAELGDTIDKTSQRVGLSAEEYQKWVYAAGLSGMDESKVEDLAKTQQTFFAQAKQGYGEVSGVVARLGYDLEELGGGAFYMDELQEVFNEWTQEIANGGEKMWDAYEALEALGISANDLESTEPDKLFSKFVSGLTSARDAANDATAAYDALGINITEIEDSGEAFNQVIAALADMEDVTQRNALASQIFGENYIALAPMLNGGSEAIQAAKQEIEDLGGVMSNQAVAASVAFQDSMTRMQTAMTGMKTQLAGDFLPAVTEIMDGMTLVMQGNVEEGTAAIEAGMAHFQEQLDQLGPLAQDALQLLVAVIVENLPTILDAGADMLTALLTGIVQQMPELIPAAVDLVTTIVDTLIDNIDLITAAAIELIVALGIGLIGAIPDLARKVPDIVKAIKDGLSKGLKDLKDVGREMIAGLWAGAWEKITDLGSDIKAGANRIIKDFEEKFHINSPSKLMRDRIGKKLGKGVGVGFVEEMGTWGDKMAKAIPSNFEVMASLNTSLKTPRTGITAAELSSSLQTAAAMAGGQEGDIVINLNTTLDGEVVSRSTTRIQRRKAKTYGNKLVTA